VCLSSMVAGDREVEARQPLARYAPRSGKDLGNLQLEEAQRLTLRRSREAAAVLVLEDRLIATSEARKAQ